MSLSTLITTIVLGGLGWFGLNTFIADHQDYPKLIEPVFWLTTAAYLLSYLRRGGQS